jgi:predicted permease
MLSNVTAGVFRDTVRSLRSWRRTPGSALLVVLALGLSGGALLTLVSLFNALFWRELPVSHPDELVSVAGVDPSVPDSTTGAIPMGLFAALDRTQTTFQDFAGFERFELAADIENVSQRLAIDGVSGRYFETLDLGAAMGRVVGSRDVDGAAPVATISFRCWQTRFGADANVIGRTFRLHGEVVTVIGVAPPAFTGLEVGMPTDAWVPVSLASRLRNRSPSLTFLMVFGRLGPGATLQLARSQIESLWPPARDAAAADVASTVGKTRIDDLLALQPRIESAARGFSASGYRVFYRSTLTLLILFSAITVVLACANLSGLLLARWSQREADLAVQSALGASNGRLICQVIGEALVFATVAVVLAAPVAIWCAKGLTLLLWNQPDASSPLDVSPDYRVLGVMVLLVGAVAFAVTLLPAARVWSAKLMPMRGVRGLPGRRAMRAGRRLVAAQVALSVPLLVTAWVVAVNLHRLEAATTGFRPDGVIVASLTTRDGSAPTANPGAYFEQLASALQTGAGVEAAALSWSEPLSFGADFRRRSITAEGGLGGARSFVVEVSPGYFETLSVPILAGRDFTWMDDRRRRDVAILSDALAGALFPGADPIGRRIRLSGQADRVLDVIGLVADARLAEPHAMNQLFLFTALLQEPARSLELRPPYLLLKSPLGTHTVAPQARRTVVALGRHELLDPHSLARTLDAALLRERAMRLGAVYFAGLTTLLVFVGLYAVQSVGVSRRIPEIGLRVALGASANDVRLLVIREALVTAGIGLVIGVPCAVWSGRLVASALTLAAPHDVLAFGAAVAVILAVTAVSALIPLRRASAITPVQALAGQ